MLVIFLGSVAAKLFSLGGVIAAAGGFSRMAGVAAVAAGAGAIVEWQIHSSFYVPTTRGYFAVPVAMMLAVAIGWALGGLARSQSKKEPN